MKEDEDYLNTLCEKVLKVQADFSQVVRLGKKSDTSRPIKVTTRSASDLTSILRATKLLANKGNEEYSSIIIKKDMTPLERDERRALVKLKKQKQMESNRAGIRATWAIRGTRVINVERNPGGATSQDALSGEEDTS